MAIIKCPHCGNEISDQVEACIHCGNKVASDESEQAATSAVVQVVCAECGKPLPEGAGTCPNCGFSAAQGVQGEGGALAGNSPEKPMEATEGPLPPPVANPADAPGVAPKKKKLSTKAKIIIAAVAAVVVIIAGVGIGFAVNAHQEQVKKEQAVAAYNQYIDDLTSATYLMLSGAADAEGLCNTTQNVWNSAIFKRSAGEWDEDIRQYYADDFNDALALLYADSSVSKKVKDIKSNQESVNSLYKKLQNPPSGLSNAYSAFEEMYDAYAKLTKLATSPSGSLQSFGTDFREADNACIQAYDKLNAKIPSKKSTK